MPSSGSGAASADPAVVADIGYLPAEIDRAKVLVYPASSGRESVIPETLSVAMTIRDLRALDDPPALDERGFEFHAHASSFDEFYDEAAVRAHYYPEVESALQALLGAQAVIVFDHNVRSSARAARGQPGVREPVGQAHNDYTEDSGPIRMREILGRAGRTELEDHEFALVNLWRPIIGPVLDNPLALCDAASVAPADLVTTDIHHFTEGNVETPSHTGVIYSLHHNPKHQWYYASAMQPDEVLLLKCYDSRDDGRARFMPHTGFQNPECPSAFVPRESIEARTLVLFAPTR